MSKEIIILNFRLEKLPRELPKGRRPRLSWNETVSVEIGSVPYESRVVIFQTKDFKVPVNGMTHEDASFD